MLCITRASSSQGKKCVLSRLPRLWLDREVKIHPRQSHQSCQVFGLLGQRARQTKGTLPGNLRIFPNNNYGKKANYVIVMLLLQLVNHWVLHHRPFTEVIKSTSWYQCEPYTEPAFIIILNHSKCIRWYGTFEMGLGWRRTS